MAPFQSAYRGNHSTKTARLKVFNGLVLIVDRESATLTLLDLSAAFNTVDHTLLLNWMTLFGHDCKQVVKINNTVSSSQDLKYGVP